MGDYACISLLTDYGLDDGFVAACHGVAATIAPHVPVIDVTHLVPAGDVRRGAAVLAQTVPYLPAGVHVAVVDPGVGTDRRAIAVSAGSRLFVGPDNGVLSWALEAIGGADAAHELTERSLWLATVSATFHGRDIFLPVAAHLAAGRPIGDVGPRLPIADLVTLPVPGATVTGDRADGEVLSVDGFGNVQLSVSDADLRRIGAREGVSLVVSVGRTRVTVPLRATFASVPPGELVAYTDSVGMVAIAVNRGDAAQRLGLPSGARVRLSPVDGG